MILLDTHAVIWLDQGHARTRRLAAARTPLSISPATVLELQFLSEAGRIRFKNNDVQALAADDRWTVDEPPAAAWFTGALDLPWTRDPFDRLIVAHARLRGWKLATADAVLLRELGPRLTLEL